jgi:hypothetical protein
MRCLRSAPAFGLLAFLLVATSPVLAQNAADQETPQARSAYVHDRDAPTIRAVRLSGTIAVDGRLDEAPWETAPVADRFTQSDPHEGEPPSQRTEVRILYDDAYIYFGARMSDSGQVRTRLGRRDAYLANTDYLTISLDTYHDHLTSFSFLVNPSGVRGDRAGFDNSWDPVWEVATSIDADGWTAEIRIPFSQLRFRRDSVQTWGIQLSRTIARTEETMVFAYTPRAERGGASRYAHLVGLEGLRPGRRLEALPYVTTRAELRDFPADHPFRSGSDYFANAGIDLKYRLTSNLTLDAAVNPDFGQVEVDPAVINLSAYETFFQERRPFFVEGAEIFGFGTAGDYVCFGCTQLFYSRRIGRAPSAFVPGARFVDAPDASRIVGAAKLTGKSPGGWSVGLLDALTRRETARFMTPDSEFGRHPVEPLTNHFALRVRRDLRQSQSTIGGMFTAVNRELDDESFLTRFRSAAYAGGLDMRHELFGRKWVTVGSLSGSHINGSPAVIRSAQRSSARYFHRPDAGHLTYDTLATSLAGYDAQLSFRRQTGEHWRGGASVAATSPGYEINDLGFQTGADRLGGSANLFYMQNRPGKLLRNWSAGSSVNSRWNYGGDFVSGNISADMSGSLNNLWGGAVWGSHNVAAYSDRLTWGGPLARTPASNNLSLNAWSDSRKRINGSAFLGLSSNTAGGKSTSVGGSLSFRPTTFWTISLSPSYSTSRSMAQYVTSIADEAAQATFGRRYVFSELDQETFALGTRFNVTFRPGLTFELYAQPFIAAGDYSNFKEFRRPGTYDFLVYGRDAGTIVRSDDATYQIDPVGDSPTSGFTISDPDFSMRSLRGNAVVRWEWRRGSTLFLVWQQSRGDFLAHPYSGSRVPGRMQFREDARGIFNIRPDNTFAIKINYWLNP